MPASDAFFRPSTPGLLEMTTTISAELDGCLACSIRAWRLVPKTHFLIQTMQAYRQTLCVIKNTKQQFVIFDFFLFFPFVLERDLKWLLLVQEK